MAERTKAINFTFIRIISHWFDSNLFSLNYGQINWTLIFNSISFIFMIGFLSVGILAWEGSGNTAVIKRWFGLTTVYFAVFFGYWGILKGRYAYLLLVPLLLVIVLIIKKFILLPHFLFVLFNILSAISLADQLMRLLKTKS